MISRCITIKNKTGLHARPASVFIQTANKFKSSILIEHKNKIYNAKSMVMVLSAGLGCGSEIILKADGDDEAVAMETLHALFEQGFGEQ
jgi:phosphocarrier protein HPr